MAFNETFAYIYTKSWAIKRSWFPSFPLNQPAMGKWEVPQEEVLELEVTSEGTNGNGQREVRSWEKFLRIKFGIVFLSSTGFNIFFLFC